MDIRSFFGNVSNSNSSAERNDEAKMRDEREPKKKRLKTTDTEMLPKSDTNAILDSSLHQKNNGGDDGSSSSNALNGQKVAVSGVLEIGRSYLEELILEYGGKISNVVTNKTNMLVIGEYLEDGRSVKESVKFKDATEKQVPIISEKDFIRDKLPSVKRKQSQSSFQRESKIDRFESLTTSSVGTVNSSNYSLQLSESQLWVDKFKPKSSAQLIGSAELVRKITEWLKNWHDVHIKKKTKVAYNKENSGARAVLLSGPPGIGVYLILVFSFLSIY